MRAVVIGPGKIGCGMLVPLLVDAGWDVTLGVRTDERAERVRRAGGWAVRDTSLARTSQVRGVRPVVVGGARFDAAVAAADLVVVAVGVGNVARLGGPLARALAGRPADRPLDVWVVENDDCAGPLEDAVARAACASGLALPPIGVASAVATVAVGRGSWDAPGRPTFVGDGHRTLAVDATRLRTPVPELPGVRATRSYAAELAAKLYVFNLGHAVAGYLGWLRGHETVDAAAADPLLRPIVVGCLLESRRAVLAAHPELGGDAHGPVAEALRRYADAELADPITRVARDPLRKLSPADRLLGPARLIEAVTGRVPAHLALAIAGALLYRAPDDAEAGELHRLLGRHGLRHVLSTVCGLEDEPLAGAIEQRYRGFIFTPTQTLFPPVQPTDALLAPRLDEALPEAVGA
jgi:mannitol-1-phosphate 5-dehydrogenase